MSQPLNLDVDRPRNLQYASNLRQDLKLLEVPEALLQEILTSGLPGAHCLLMNGKAASLPPLVATARAKSHIEVVPTAPRLETLDALLAERPYGAADEGCDPSTSGPGEGLYTFKDLLERVQASAAELRTALKEAGAVQLGEVWRLVDPAYLGQVLELLILSATELGCPLDAIPGTDMVQALEPHGCDPRIVAHCLHLFGTRKTEGDGPSSMDVDGADQPGVGLWSLSEQAVCRQFAQKLLPSGKLLALDEFLEAWQQEVPAGMQPTMKMLAGEVLVDTSGEKPRVKRFAVRELPRDPVARFRALFKERARWEEAELEPYLQGLQVVGQSVQATLLQHARACQNSQNDPIYYTVR